MLSQPFSRKKMLCQELLRHVLLTALEQRPVVTVPVCSVEQHCPHHPQEVDNGILCRLPLARPRRSPSSKSSLPRRSRIA
jgi:hypothetical protein